MSVEAMELQDVNLKDKYAIAQVRQWMRATRTAAEHLHECASGGLQPKHLHNQMRNHDGVDIREQRSKDHIRTAKSLLEIVFL